MLRTQQATEVKKFVFSDEVFSDIFLVSSGQFRGHGNSFHGHGGHGSRLAQLRMCIRVLLSMCQVRDEVTMQDLHDQGAIPLLVGKLSFSTHTHTIAVKRLTYV